MLSRNIFRASMMMKQNAFTRFNTVPRRVFSSVDLGMGDMTDITKVNYTEEFDQGLTPE